MVFTNLISAAKEWLNFITLWEFWLAVVWVIITLMLMLMLFLPLFLPGCAGISGGTLSA